MDRLKDWTERQRLDLFLMWVRGQCAAESCVLTKKGFVPLSRLLEEYLESKKKEAECVPSR